MEQGSRRGRRWTTWDTRGGLVEKHESSAVPLLWLLRGTRDTSELPDLLLLKFLWDGGLWEVAVYEQECREFWLQGRVAKNRNEKNSLLWVTLQLGTDMVMLWKSGWCLGPCRGTEIIQQWECISTVDFRKCRSVCFQGLFWVSWIAELTRGETTCGFLFS